MASWRWRRLLGAGALVVGGLTAATCAGPGPGWDSGSGGAPGGSAGARARDSVLLVRSEACGAPVQGSGVVVARNGVPRLLTNAHVVGGADRVSAGGDEVPVLSSATGLDAAVVAAPPGAPALRTGPLPGAGATVTVLGHPGGRFDGTTGRVVAGSRRVGPGGAADVVLLDVPVRGGHSGGAVLDGRGRVVALVVARDPASGGAVAYPVDEVLDAASAPSASSC